MSAHVITTVSLVHCETHIGMFGLGLRLLNLAAMLRVKPLTPFVDPDFVTTPPAEPFPSFGQRNLGWASAGSI